MIYIIITGQVIGGNGRDFEIVWNSDMQEHRTLKQAISHGFKTRESDDFRIGYLSGKKLKRVSWMGEKQFDREEVEYVANQLGVGASR